METKLMVDEDGRSLVTPDPSGPGTTRADLAANTETVSFFGFTTLVTKSIDLVELSSM